LGCCDRDAREAGGAAGRYRRRVRVATWNVNSVKQRVPRLLPPPVGPHESVFARPTVAVEFTGRPSYAVVQQGGPARSGGRVVHWVDLHTGPLTWQIRDQAGLSSVTEVLHRAYTSAIAVFSDGAQHQDDPTSGDHNAA